MTLFARLLRRFGYVRVADYGLVVTEGGHILRVSDGSLVNAPAALPPRFRPPTPPGGFAPRSAIPAPLFNAESTPQPSPAIEKPSVIPAAVAPPSAIAPPPVAPPTHRVPPPPLPRRAPARRFSAASDRTVVDRGWSLPKTVVDERAPAASARPAATANPPSRPSLPSRPLPSRPLTRPGFADKTIVDVIPAISRADADTETTIPVRQPTSPGPGAAPNRDLLPRLSRRLAERKKAG